MVFIKRLILIILLFIPLSLLSSKAYAASLSSASDTLTTSRPSAAAPLAANQAANATQVTVVDLPTTGFNSALWIASDSAVLLNDTGQTLSTINVASMSAANTPASDQRIVYFTGQVANTHHAGTTMYTSITATHTIQFTTNAAVPGSGHIVIEFPGNGANTASPSATGFSFNGMTTSDPTDVKFNNATCASVSVTGSNTIDCTLDSSGINADTVVTVLIGCAAQSSGVCTTFAPRLINPIKTTTAAGSADQWKITIKTQDNNAIDLDTSRIIAGTVESVQVQGIVEPYMTMTIAGVSNGASACSDTTNTGLASTATFVNMGSLGTAQVNKSAQTITIDTNGSFGYKLTATSSGTFINPASGFAIADANGGNGLVGNSSTDGTNPAPAALSAGTAGFGIHPCSTSGSPAPTVPSGWGTGGGASNNYANPWNTGTNGYYALLASTSLPSAASVTTVEYGASVTSTTPAGIYSTVFTYVATASF